MEPAGIRNLKIVLLVASVVSLAFLMLAAFEENFRADWRHYQRQYAAALRAGGSSDKPVDYALEVRQVYLEGLIRVDRCVSCHVGIENPDFRDAEQPLAAHPGDVLKHHPADKFGCTICHLGQGRALHRAAAHGRTAHWPEPMLEGKLVYTSCGRCHYENDLYGGQADLYGRMDPLTEIPRGALTASLPGADALARGKQLVVRSGCLGCHKYRGRGGVLGPDITHVGDKTPHDFDFTHVSGARTVRNWLITHFQAPAVVSPNSIMPEYEFTDTETADLAAYMISLKRKSAPAAYTPVPRPVDQVPVRGDTLYAMYCASCHGVDGLGATVRDPSLVDRVDMPRELITPSLRNADTLSVASSAFLAHIIAHGRPGTSMPAWDQEGLSSAEINRLVTYIRQWEPSAADLALISATRGNARYGAALFRANCAGCHGADGSGGGVGVSLNSPTFLSIASDQFLAATILNGRANTAMPAWHQFDNRAVSDLLAYLRTWAGRRSARDEVLELLAANRIDRRDESASAPQLVAAPGVAADAPSVRMGKTLYRSRCTVCHGAIGEGGIGPSLNNQSMLTAVNDEYLHDTIVRGHPGTAMPAWWQLSSRDVADVITYLRHWQTLPTRKLPRAHVTGDPQNGQILYHGMCTSCHGPNAEGAIGPQLANPAFQDAIADEVLIDWISYGRRGTQMRPFARGMQGAVELSHSQIVDIVTYLRSLRGQVLSGGQRIGLGFAPRGAILFGDMCAGCHGPLGEGGSGPAIRNPAFLAAATDGFLRATIVLGREGTEMRSMAHRGSGIVELSADQIDDVVAFLRSHADLRQIPHRFVNGASLRSGAELFAGMCAGCHGPEGKGAFAPELNNPEFLRAATDGYLQATIVRGRRGTAMRSFSISQAGLANLTQAQINDIVGFIRQWSPDQRPLRRAEPFAPQTPVPHAVKKQK